MEKDAEKVKKSRIAKPSMGILRLAGMIRQRSSAWYVTRRRKYNPDVDNIR